MSALEKTGDGQWQALAGSAAKTVYRNCANGQQHQVCNWMVPANDPNPFCGACRLNEIIPDLTEVKNRGRWNKLEQAKRRCIYTFLKLGLPLQSEPGGAANPLRFQFLQDNQNAPVKTGHQDGVITLNIAEADDDEREHRRLNLHEPYRTLIGHLRHESGHFYWDRLIAHSPNLPGFREFFGDETLDYEAALQAYYQQGPPADWPVRTVTAYASSHPWEDWAETWAHYLHIMDTMETAANFGVGVKAENVANDGSAPPAAVQFSAGMDFDQLLAEWIPLTCALNAINRGMGLTDLYPFVIPPAVVAKLRFIHRIVQEAESLRPDEAALPVNAPQLATA